LTEDKI